MSIEETLKRMLTEAMRSKDTVASGVIRMIKTKVMERRTAKGFEGEVNDALYQDVIAAYSKSLQKAREQFLAAGDKGAGQAAELAAEIEFCAQFLPEKMGDDEIRKAVRIAIVETGVTEARMAGRVVGAVMKAHKGKADPADVKRIVTEELTNG